ncbi:hypothetical protein AGMMS49950_11420 [Endomicrobiia bacterium]|nr:hypothetical protein AGMMS49950_11420 [Endomicrobiia bacterium]
MAVANRQELAKAKVKARENLKENDVLLSNAKKPYKASLITFNDSKAFPLAAAIIQKEVERIMQILRILNQRERIY